MAKREHPIEAEAAKMGVPQAEIELRRPMLRAYMRNFQLHYDKTKAHYFFTDLFQENASRFPVTLDDCWRSPAD